MATQITPPNAGEREDVPDALRMHAVDPLSSIVQLLHQATATGHCDGASRSYDDAAFSCSIRGRSVRKRFHRHVTRYSPASDCDATSRTERSPATAMEPAATPT